MLPIYTNTNGSNHSVASGHTPSQENESSLLSMVSHVPCNRHTTQFRIKNAAILLIALLLIKGSATAQCNVFSNADSANPVLSVLPAGTTVASLDFVDIDDDGDLDCYYVPAQGTPVLLRNVGTKHHPIYKQADTSGFEGLVTPVASPIIQFVDIDGDGDYDCFITQVSYSFRPVTSILFYRNTGTKQAPQFSEDDANNPVAFAQSGNNYVLFTFADINKDGKMDFYYTGFYNAALTDYDQFTYWNTGTATAPVFTLYTNEHPHDFERQRTYYDWNGDGMPDYIKFDNSQNIYTYQQNLGPLQQPSFNAITSNSPVFNNGMPYRMVDLNDDGAPEVFTTTGHYSTVVPMAIIGEANQTINGKPVIKLFSKYQAAGYTYQWEFNGVNLPASSKPFIYAIKPGKYVLYVTGSCGTGVSLATVVTGSTANNLIAANTLPDAAMSAVRVTAYPNPFTSAVTVQLPSAKEAVTSTIKITDVAGKVLMLKTTSSAVTQTGQGLQPGTYLIEVWQKGELVYHTKLIKQ